jgi:pimeloyl-ACP methyl ester carboxylesterase
MNKTICILGGTPSTIDIIGEIPRGIEAQFNVISFNRPGFGGVPNCPMNKERLFRLAEKAGLKHGDFSIIGISGGAPLAILLAYEFNIKNCCVISGMTSNETYFVNADQTITKPLLNSVFAGYDSFKIQFGSFPNIDQVISVAGSSKELVIRGIYDELRLILSQAFFSEQLFDSVNLTWWHGEQDKNVNIGSVKLFLSKFKNAKLNIVPNQGHDLDVKNCITQTIEDWNKSKQ